MASSTGPKAKPLPSWQQDTALEGPASSTDMSEPSTPQPIDGRTSVLEKASKFLKENDIRDAPSEKKRSFLQSKGLSKSEIDKLLSSEANLNFVPAGTGQQIQEVTDNSTPKESSTKDRPPIITYPEFLLYSQKPSSLITFQRLLKASYITSGAAIAVSGTSKFVIEPMIESLSSARHSLYGATSAQIAILTEKLEGSVSKIPTGYIHFKEGDPSDAESITSDGARFFSRTTGTQTSPQRSRSLSTSSTSSSAEAIGPAISQSSRLFELQKSLQAIRPKDSANDSIKQSVDGLKQYLDGLPYRSSTQIAGMLDDDNSEDSAARMKAEIRKIKGVLLSARNFPSSMSVR